MLGIQSSDILFLYARIGALFNFVTAILSHFVFNWFIFYRFTPNFSIKLSC